MSSYAKWGTTWAVAPVMGGLDGLEFCDMSKIEFQPFTTGPDTLVYSELTKPRGTTKVTHLRKRHLPTPPAEKTHTITLCKGINFLGICGNDMCRVCGQEVTCKLVSRDGFGSFDLGKDTCGCTCPICDTVCESITTCAFYACSWTFEGMLAKDSIEAGPAKKYRKQGGEGKANASDGYFVYKGDLTSWRYLHFNVTPIPSTCLVKLKALVS